MSKDKYAVVKGKALSLIREFVKVYPDYNIHDLNARIAHEVIFASQSVFKDNDYSRAKTQAICFEIKETITGVKCSISDSNPYRTEIKEELTADLH